MSHRPHKKKKNNKQPNKVQQGTGPQLTEFTLSLTLKAPILTAGYGALNYGYDMQILRDHHNKQVLPGSLIKGNLRHSLSEMIWLAEQSGMPLPIDKSWINAWFGQEAESGNAPRRGKLHFDFYWCHQQEEKKTLLNRIAIDDAGSTEAGSLAFIESAFPAGETVTFSGKIQCFTESKAQRAELKNALYKAAQFTDALGGLKSVGFGAVESVSISESQPEPVKATAVTDSRVLYTMTFDRPVCFPLRSSQGNRFESQERISGAVIKGALANKPTISNLLKNHLDKVRFSFVYPKNEAGRQLPVPRSLVEVEGQEDLIDIAKTPLHIEHLDKAVFWQDDWKDNVFDKLDRMALDKTMVVRTAVEPLHTEQGVNKKYGTAKAHQLFSYVCLMHEQTTTTPEEGRFSPTPWQGFFDVERVPEAVRGSVRKELMALLSAPLFPLGKTRATGSVTNFKGQLQQPLASLNTASRIIVTLAAPAWLHHYNLSSILATQDLSAHYEKVFSALSDNSLCLADHYSSQYLSGGSYIQNRYFSQAPFYQPQLLTEAGSVFVFSVIDSDKATKVLNKWQCEGLPPVPEQWGTDDNGDERWAENPYNRANGFGEVNVEVITGDA